MVANVLRPTPQDMVKGKIAWKGSFILMSGQPIFIGLVYLGYQKHYRVNYNKNELSITQSHTKMPRKLLGYSQSLTRQV